MSVKKLSVKKLSVKKLSVIIMTDKVSVVLFTSQTVYILIYTHIYKMYNMYKLYRRSKKRDLRCDGLCPAA